MSKDAMTSMVLHFALRYPDATPQYHLVGVKDGEAVRYDGPHSDEVQVAKARKLCDSIYPQLRPDRWLMVITAEVPDLDPPVNEEAMETCRALVARYYKEHPDERV